MIKLGVCDGKGCFFVVGSVGVWVFGVSFYEAE